MPMCGPVPLDSRPSGHYPHNNHSHINLYPLNIIYVPTQILKQTRLGLVVVQPSNVNHIFFSVAKATLILQMTFHLSVCHQHSSASKNCNCCLMTFAYLSLGLFSQFLSLVVKHLIRISMIRYRFQMWSSFSSGLLHVGRQLLLFNEWKCRDSVNINSGYTL